MTRILYDFLQHGQLGRIDIGMSIDETLAYLGVPNGFESIDAFYTVFPQLRTDAIEHHPARMFPMLFGSLEMWIVADTNQIEMFQIDFHDNGLPSIPSILDDGWLPLMYQVTRARCGKLLRSYQIKSLQVDQGRWADYICQLWLPASGVQINFDLEDGADAMAVLWKSELSDACVTHLCMEFT
jgi:hypothetical protein